MEDLKKISRYLKRQTPSHTIHNDIYRREGVFENYDEYHKGYSVMLIYVQLGLIGFTDTIYEILNMIKKIQSKYLSENYIVPACFGNQEELLTNGKFFNYRGYFSKHKMDDIVNEISELCMQTEVCEPIYIPKLYPKPSKRTLYGGKVKFEASDLMFVVGKKGKIRFSSKLKSRLTKRLKKRIVCIEIDDIHEEWHYKNYEPDFIDVE